MNIITQNNVIQFQTQRNWQICYLQVKTILEKKNLREETRFQFDMLNLKRRDLYIMKIIIEIWSEKQTR